MEMDFSRMERIVGAFIVGVILLLMATLVIIGRGKDWFETYIIYYTTFNESYNLQENASVKLFRADIGKVTGIALEKNRVRVKLAILEKYASRIREDAVAEVESPTLIGSEYISIVPGSPDAPLLSPDGEIASREKRSLTDILTEFEVEKTAKMLVQAMQDISQIAAHLSDPKGPLWSSLDNLERVTADVQQITSGLEAGRGPLGVLLKSEDLLQRMTENIRRIDVILENIDTAGARAPHAMALLEENLVIFGQSGQSIQASMQQVQHILADVHQAADDLQVIMQNVKTGSHRMPQITATFKEGIQEIRQGVEQVNRVVESMQRSILIRTHLPPEALPAKTDAGARP
ncbi:MAG: MCE family protein [Desulfobacteraceae bacterium]|nr:MAG: MCE family protein [Desulfobacteraceae bacterium]